MIEAITQSHIVQGCFAGGAISFSANHARQHHVFERGEFRQQKISLENKAHFPVSHFGLRRRAAGVKPLPFKFDRAELGPLQSCEGVKQRRFSGPRGAAEKNGFAVRHLHRDAAQHFDPARTDPERAAKIAGDKLRFGHGAKAFADSPARAMRCERKSRPAVAGRLLAMTGA